MRLYEFIENEHVMWLYELLENDEEHQQALDDSGFWGKAGAGVLFLAENTGRILFSHRSNEVLQPGTWGVWGGAIDSNENPKVAARREAVEETGINISQNEIIPLYVFHDADSGFKYSNFLVLVEEEFDPIMNWETKGYKWVEFGKWPSPLHFGAQALLKDSSSIKIIKKISATT